MTIAGGCHKRGDDIAVAIAEGNHFVAFQMFVPTKSEIIPTLILCCRRSITVDDADIEAIVLVKMQHRARENNIKATAIFEAPEGPIDPGVVDLRSSIFVLFNGQLLPLTAEVQQLEDVIKNRMQS